MRSMAGRGRCAEPALTPARRACAPTSPLPGEIRSPMPSRTRTRKLRRTPRSLDRRSGAESQSGRAGDQETQAGAGAVFLRRSARRAARQDHRRRRCPGADAQRRHHDDDAARQGYRAQDRLSGVYRRRRLRHGGDAGRRRLRHGCRPGDVSGAALVSNNGTPNTGWLLCDIYFTNGKPVPFSTRQILRDALARLGVKVLTILPGLKSSSIFSSLKTRAWRRSDATWPPRGARGEPAQSGLPVSDRVLVSISSTRRWSRSGAASRRSACRCARWKSNSGRASANSPFARNPGLPPPTR